MEGTQVAPSPSEPVACFPIPQVANVTAGTSPGRTLLQRVRALNGKPIYPWRRVPNYVRCTLFTAMGGFCFGFDTGSIGPITVMSQFEHQFFNDQKIDPMLQGLIVSSILLTASLASLLSGPLSNKISRIRTISLGAVVFAAGCAIACSAGSLAQLFVGRCIAGTGEGVYLSAITVYTIEIAPASARGRLGSALQVLITIGLATGYLVCYGTSQLTSSLSWRFPFGIQAIVSVVLGAGCPLLPHSPRWLHHVGRHDEARAAWERLGVAAADVEKTEQAAQREAAERGSFWTEMWKKGIRGRTFLGVFLSAMQQASGIDGVLYYAPVLFTQAGLSGTTSSFVASGVSGIIMVVVTFSCQFFTDTWGRRPSMIRGGYVIALSMLIIGALYASNATASPAGRWAVIVLIYVFVIGYTSTWAICVRIICSEIQPTRTRAAVSSLGQCANWVINWIIAFTTPLFLAKSSSGPYFLFGACSLVTTFVCVAYQPETRGASLEDSGLPMAMRLAVTRIGSSRRRADIKARHVAMNGTDES
ncbi:hypothetical protein PHLGIDRAFT_31456 [Phlebiopsis gigantea 11061_1 CR5-6]|uniref:Major facilitator superfamily (MFS) profile domain-containing protein n=1 Tax=Phlebiopsis gigantea (strain 11061_1 CR5-6) TaxID=745531 RepID=A0A0C3S6P8_PHLG1|nr:hypothetical protein PHLGIDRAFT_31456 [Phlebiopsis gigantea 11061_1 CR5-6]